MAGWVKLVGPQLRRVIADELYVPLLQSWRKLGRVEVLRWIDSNGTQPLDLLTLANLPALRTLHVMNEAQGLLRIRQLKELTQLGSLRLLLALPDEPVLPAGLTYLELECLADDIDAAGIGPSTAHMMENHSGSLGKLVLLGGKQLFNNDPGHLSGLACLQQLRHLSLDFQDYSLAVRHFAFPQLQSMCLTLGGSTRPPRWNFSGCPVLQHLVMYIQNGGQQQTDLRQVVGLRAERLELGLFIYPSTRRIGLCAATWALGSVWITDQSSGPAASWQACRPYVQDALRGLLGAVPFSKVIVDGVLATALVG